MMRTVVLSFKLAHSFLCRSCCLAWDGFKNRSAVLVPGAVLGQMSLWPEAIDKPIHVNQAAGAIKCAICLINSYCARQAGRQA